MTPDDADTAYRHLVDRRDAEFDRDAMTPEERDSSPAWLGGGIALVVLAAVSGLGYALWTVARAAWGLG